MASTHRPAPSETRTDATCGPIEPAKNMANLQQAESRYNQLAYARWTAWPRRGNNRQEMFPLVDSETQMLPVSVRYALRLPSRPFTRICAMVKTCAGVTPIEGELVGGEADVGVASPSAVPGGRNPVGAGGVG